MCIAVPHKVLSVDGLLAEIAAQEGRRTISLSLLSEVVKAGDYVTLQAGRYAVGRMDAEEAGIRLALFDELAEAMAERKELDP